MGSEAWEHGRNAIVITLDEDDYSDRDSLAPAAAAPTRAAATS